MSLTDAHIAALSLARQAATQKATDDDEVQRMERWRQMHIDMLKIVDYKDDKLSPEQRMDLMAERKKRYLDELKASGPLSEAISAHIQQTEKEIKALKEAQNPNSDARRDFAAFHKFIKEDEELNNNAYIKELKAMEQLRKSGKLSAEQFDRESERLTDTYVLDPEKKKIIDRAFTRMAEQPWLQRVGITFDPEEAGRERLAAIEKRNAADKKKKGEEAKPQTVGERVSAFLQEMGKNPLKDDSSLRDSSVYPSAVSNFDSKTPLGPTGKSDERSK